MIDNSHDLKGQCHEIFCFWFFSWISFPQAPEYTIRAVSNFFRGDICSSRLTTGINDTGGKFATGINDTGGKFATGVNDTGGKQWEQYQAADTLKWTWRQKFVYMLSLLSKGVPTKLLKFFWLKIFFICQRHRWSTLSCEYLRKFSKKFEMVLIGHSGVGGKLIHKINQRQKISWHCPFNKQKKNASLKVYFDTASYSRFLPKASKKEAE